METIRSPTPNTMDLKTQAADGTALGDGVGEGVAQIKRNFYQ